MRQRRALGSCLRCSADRIGAAEATSLAITIHFVASENFFFPSENPCQCQAAAFTLQLLFAPVRRMFDPGGARWVLHVGTLLDVDSVERCGEDPNGINGSLLFGRDVKTLREGN
ncbi:hypothetical protein BJY00DRAFT_282782 [Aspergillus carlsbadensis]|nr:hypothetical protein BJY00DRAFT_282782 [Aspergillus carlsbadensis]